MTKRAKFVVEIDLEPVRGLHHTKASMLELILSQLRPVWHYNPVVTIMECKEDEYRACRTHKVLDQPMTISPEGWCVEGRYATGGGGGVLEWCENEEQAKKRVEFFKDCDLLAHVQVGKV